MVIRRKGEIAGTVGGRLIEATAIKKAHEMFRDKGFARFQFDMTRDVLTNADMVCGGKLELMVEYLPADQETSNIVAGIQSCRRNNHRCFLITGLPEVNEGKEPLKRCLLSPGVTCAPGSDGFLEVMERVKDIVHALSGPSLVEIDEKQFWVDPILNTGVLHISGAGHISSEVCDLAQRVGCMTMVLDDRAEFANEARFNKPAEVIVLKSFDNCFEGLAIDENSYAVIVTRGHLYDKIVLEAYTLAEKVLIYSIGRVMQSGLLSEVFNKPVNHEVVSLVNLKKLYPGDLLT